MWISREISQRLLLLNKKKRVFDILQIGQSRDIASKVFDYVLVLVIVVNILVMVFETFDSLKEFRFVFEILEIVCILFFAMEYILRIWTSDYLYPDVSRGRAAANFIFSFDGIVELFTILPFFFLSGFVVFRMLRVVRIFHLFRLNANYDSFNVITTVLKEKKNQILSSLFILFVLVLGASICMYSAEHEVQPEVFDNAFSGIWWSVSTILTIGYGDMYPVTVAGRIMAVIISVLGVGVVAIPTGIISAGFVEYYSRMQREEQKGRGTIALNATPESGLIGLDMEGLANDFGILPLVIIRDGAVVIPTDDIRITNGDTLVYYDDSI